MKKEIFSVCLLLVMLITAFINTYSVGRMADEISSHITDSVEAANSDNWEAAEHSAVLAEKMWTEKTWYTHIVLRHSEIDTVSDALYDYITYIYAHDEKSYITAAGKVKYHLDSIYQMEQVRFGSIF